jgi:hypothetical protein
VQFVEEAAALSPAVALCSFKGVKYLYNILK